MSFPLEAPQSGSRLGMNTLYLGEKNARDPLNLILLTVKARQGVGQFFEVSPKEFDSLI